MGVKGRAERCCGILFQRGGVGMLASQVGKVGPIGGLWLADGDGGECERGTAR
jgi:hypothetical protein